LQKWFNFCTKSIGAVREEHVEMMAKKWAEMYAKLKKEQ
jgi:hypothetical protein